MIDNSDTAANMKKSSWQVIIYLGLSIAVTGLLSLWQRNVAGIILISTTGFSIILLVLTIVSVINQKSRLLPTILLSLFMLAIGTQIISLIMIISGNAGLNNLIPGLSLILNEPDRTGISIATMIVSSVLLLIQAAFIILINRRVTLTAALFFRDALPGHQMAVETREHNGTISSQEATIQQQSLQYQGDVLGALDGESKLMATYIKWYISGILALFLILLLGHFSKIPSLLRIDLELLLLISTITMLPSFLVSMIIVIISVRSYSEWK